MKFPSLNLKNYKSNRYKNNTTSECSLEEEKHRIALELSKVGLWDWNIITNKVFYSKESKQIIGYADNELKNTSEFFYVITIILNRVIRQSTFYTKIMSVIC